MSVVGTSLLKADGNPYYGPSFPRGGLAGTFPFDITHISGGPTFRIEVEHRDEHDTSFTVAGTIGGITAANPVSVDITGIKQIVRYKYTFDAGDDPTDMVHFVAQAPSWRPYP